MKTHRVFAVVLFGLCLTLAFGLLAEPAAAQSADQKLAQQTGLGSKKIDAEKLPGKLEMGLAFGSVVAAIAAIKYL
ncbi:MAG: hypothetical protein GXY15_02790 [Candidatus Hydrogenedentes bacterium]|mgnify:CR=1 FL=1|nr:hypothetical protein [Candidatus Hydrogenedentota bacterium]